ncbi:MAG: SDR family NAD(P)-dependent oxidoreductase [Phycisphaerales bacterium]|nr:MAG: SDR family NAD(P)-dependent oxidoreductase [Phycisphaerales bacterium]
MTVQTPLATDSALGAAYERTTCCVTGGAGFVGAHLVEALLGLGARVVIVDDLSTGDAELVSTLLDAHAERLRFVHASVLESRALDDAFERVGTVFHLAAFPVVSRSLAEPERCIDVNVRGTVEVCQAARAAGAKRVVLASSAAVYGQEPPTPTPEDAPVAPASPYAASKLGAEHVLGTWRSAFGLQSQSLRLFNVYGPRQPAEDENSAVISAFMKRARDGQAPVIYGDGMQTRDFVHVHDVVRAFLLAGSPGREADGRAINIGTGRAVDLLTLAKSVWRAHEREPVRPEHTRVRPGDVRHSCADVSLAERALGFRASVSLDEGIAGLVQRRKGEPAGSNAD